MGVLWKSIKMEAFKLCILAFAFVATLIVYTLTEMNYTLYIALLVVEFIIFVGLSYKNNPKERLNEYLIAKTVPFSQRKNIYQKPDKKQFKSLSCGEVQSLILKKRMEILDGVPSGQYRTITHASIRSILIKKCTVTKDELLGKHSIFSPTIELMSPRCFNKCIFTCRKLWQRKVFYYIEFTVPTKTK